MAGTGHRIGIAGLALALGVASAPAAGASDATSLPALHRVGSARFVERTVTTRKHRRVVLHTVGVADYRRRLRQATTRPTGIQAVETRTLGDDLYSRGAPHTSSPPGRPWTHVRSDFVPDDSVEDPADLLRGYRPQRPAVRRVGTTTVRGVHTTHYRLTSTVPVAPKLRAAGLIGGEGHTDVWVDRHGRVRRLRQPTPAGLGSGASVSVTDYFDFGVAVQVDRPAADTVTDERRVPEPQRATGPPVTIGSGTADGIPWRVRRIPTDRGSCLNLRTGHRDQPFGFRIPGAHLLGAPCVPTPDASSPEYDLNLSLLRNGAQIVAGLVPASTTGVTVHLDDGSTQELVPTGGGVAFAIVGDRIAPTVVVHAPTGDSTCSLSAEARSYSCSGGPYTFGDATVPTFDTSPTTAPPGR